MINPDVIWITSVAGLLVIMGTMISRLPSPRDFTPPSIGISYPDEGATVQGNVDIGVHATDSSGIDRVEITLNCTQPIANFTHPPYTIVWDTTPLAVKRYQLCVTAWDAAGLSSRVTRDVFVTLQKPIMAIQ